MGVQIILFYFIVTICGLIIPSFADDDDWYDSYEDVSEICGGSVAVSGSMELSYENPGESGDERTCIWALYTPHGGPIGLTLLDHKFGDTTGSTGSCSSLSLQMDFNGGPMSAGLNIQAQDKGMEQSTRLRDSVLVFTSRGGQSFRLRLRPTSPYTFQPAVGRHISSVTGTINTNVTVHTFWPSTSPQQVKQFSYPSIPGAHYEDGEVQMLIFGSVPRHRVSISIDFVDTEPSHDILSLYKWSTTNRRFLFVQRFHGHLGNLPASTIEGSENQPIFLRFQSDSSNSGGGFKLSYNYKIVNDDPAAASVTVKTVEDTLPVKFGPCGDFIIVDNEVTTVAYKNNGSNNTEEVCVWIIAATNGGILGVTLIHQDFDNCNSSEGKLNLQIKPVAEGSMIAHRIGAGDQGMEIVTQHGIIFLVFTSKGSGGLGGAGGQSFQLKFRRLGYYQRLKDLKISGHMLGGRGGSSNNNNFTFSYPTYPAIRYEGHDRCEVIIKPMPGKIIHLSVNLVDTEMGRDHLDIFAFAKSYNKFWLMQRLSGRLGSLTTSLFEGQENQPMALAFETDATDHGSGFSMTFSYQPAPDPSSSETRGEESFDPCHSIINVPGKSELAYRNLGDNGNTCVWVISATTSGVGITLTEVYGSDGTSFGSLSLYYGFGSPEISVMPEILGLADRGMEQIIPKVATVIIFTSSIRGQGFRLRLRNYSQHQPMPPGGRRSNFRASMLERINNNDDSPTTFSYPVSINYPDNDDRLFIFYSAPLRKVRLQFQFVDTEPDHDHLTIYKFSKMDQMLIPVQRLTGRLSTNVSATLEGNENQPVFIYFKSDSSNVGRGFRLSYSYEIAEPESATTTTTTTTTKRTPRRFANRTRSPKLIMKNPAADPTGPLQTDQNVSASITADHGHTALYVGLGLSFIVVACGAVYFLFCSGRSLVKTQQCLGITTIFSSCPALPGHNGESLHPVPRPSSSSVVGRQRLRSLQEDENF